MKKLILGLIFVLAFALTAFLQTPKPTPPDDEVVKISTTLIQIDVTVTDSKGNLVTGLKPAGFEIYNAKLDGAKKPNLTAQICVFREGKLMLEGKPNAVEFLGQTDVQRIKSAGAINLAGGMPTGEYILQIIITDNVAKEKRKISTRFVQFEITE